MARLLAVVRIVRDYLALCRSIIRPHQRRFKSTSKHAASSTGSPSYVISLPVIPKGVLRQFVHIPPCYSHSHASGALTSYAYVEFAEDSHVEAALAMNDSLFRGRLIKVSTIQLSYGRHLSMHARSHQNELTSLATTADEAVEGTAEVIAEAIGAMPLTERVAGEFSWICVSFVGLTRA